VGKKIKKAKKSKEEKLVLTGWDTTDAEEIERRCLRGKVEKFTVKNVEPGYDYFGAFHVSSQKDKQYKVETRSLVDNINSCNCPDYRGNGLGTCKHIEHILFRLRKSGVKKFKQAQMMGSSRVEIFLDSRHPASIKIIWPLQYKSIKDQQIDAFFSTDGTLLGNPIVVYSALKKTIIEKKKLRIRLSSHIDHFIENQRNLSQKQLAKEIFLADVQLGKRTLDMVKFPLYPYQHEGMLHLAFNERALLADEMGLGKTVQAIAACELLRRHRNVQRVLIIATASLKSEWEEQISKFTGLSSVTIQGVRANRLKQYQLPAFFYLTNYEQVVMDGADIQHLLSPDIIILDEAQRIKNWQTKTATAIKQLQSRYAFVLTGTPIENRIDDVYSIVQFLDPDIFGPLFRFNRDFYELDEKGKPIGYKNLDEMHRRLRPVMLRRRKNDVEGQLPERTVNNYFVKMEEEQYSRYTEYQDRVARLLSQAKRRPLRKEEFEKLQQWLACMRMVCDTPYILDPDCRISPKLSELENILEELLEDETSKIIIFSEWERMLQLVREMAQNKQLDFAWHTGSVPQHKRRAEINRFKEDSNCRLFLSTDSGSVGLNLQAANVVINLDLPWNPAKLEQRIARAWRKHQTRAVKVINLVCEDSIEHRMLGLLAQKQALAEGVLEGGGDLKEMKLPSGRNAFMERMENLMGFSAAATESKATVSSPIEKQESIQDVSPEVVSALELIDPKTLETLQRLAEAGIITLNHPNVLHASPLQAVSRRQQRDKKITHAKKYLDQAERKQRMAEVLISSDFIEEAIKPLREALEATLHSFAWLTTPGENILKEVTCQRFIQDDLINQYGLPEKTFSLLHHLKGEIELEPNRMKIFLSDHKEIFQHVDQALNKMRLE